MEEEEEEEEVLILRNLLAPAASSSSASKPFKLHPVPSNWFDRVIRKAYQSLNRLWLVVKTCFLRTPRRIQILENSKIQKKFVKLAEARCRDDFAGFPVLSKRLWDGLKPGMEIPLDAQKKLLDYGELGFQNGVKPETDLRSMGLLAMDQLVWFAENRSQDAREALLISSHPKHYFPFAATGVNISLLCLDLLREGRIDCFNENQKKPKTFEETFHPPFAELFFQFAKYWERERPKSVLEFPRLFQNFTHHVRGELLVF